MTALSLRLAGAALLTLSGALLGYSRTLALKRRLALLRELDSGLGRMADELALLQTPLPELFGKLRDRPLFNMLHDGFGTERLELLWRRAAEALELPEADRKTVADLAAVIGRYDAPRQAAEIALARTRLAQSARSLERELDGRARRYAGLGAALGAMLAVVLF